VTRFLLVRHGESEWNALGRWQGLSDPPLSDLGREEARMAASTLGDFDGLIFASPLIRARQTAEIIAKQLGERTVLIEPDLREIDVGDFSGLTSDEIQEKMPEAWTALREGRLDTFPGGESRSDFRERVQRALEGLAARHEGAEILVVTHGGTIGDVERYLGVHPGVGVRNLEGRWFELGEALIAVGDRVPLAETQSS
jgi:2,3-bisphosphoglycerate-dependent phosphoglycerate mutase